MGTPHAAETPGRLARLARGPSGFVAKLSRALPHAVDDLFRDRCPQYAAAIAYRVLFSLFPLTILLVSVFGLVLQDDELRERVISELVSVLPVSPSGEQNVQSTIEQIASPLSAIGLISLVALLWGASGMMASIRIGLEAAFKVDRGRPAAHAKLVDFVLVGASGLLVLGVIGISTFAAFFNRAVAYTVAQLGLDIGSTPSGSVVRDGLQLLLIAVMTVMLYRFVPAESLGRRSVLVGASFTAIGIWGASKLLAVLVDFTRYNVIYGSLAGVMTFLIFVYVVAMILLLGAELAYAWSLPAGPPGPPLRTQLKHFLLGLVIRTDAPEDTEKPPGRP